VKVDAAVINRKSSDNGLSSLCVVEDAARVGNTLPVALRDDNSSPSRLPIAEPGGQGTPPRPAAAGTRAKEGGRFLVVEQENDQVGCVSTPACAFWG
jgi:hypothetical protein